MSSKSYLFPVRLSIKHPLIGTSAFDIYMNPETSNKTEIDRQVLLCRIQVITLIPKTVLCPSGGTTRDVRKVKYCQVNYDLVGQDSGCAEY